MVASEDEIAVLEEHDAEEFNEPSFTDVPSVLSTLPVALVVEQTARILEEIKRKIIQRKEEEEEQRKLEQQDGSESPTYFALPRPIRTSSEDGIFNSNIGKSFIILNNQFDTVAQTKPVSPSIHATVPRSLSPDSGTDFEPFSASSSISPPFLFTTNISSSERVKPFSSFSHFVPTTSSKQKAASPTTSLNSIYSSVRRSSGVRKSTASLAKSTPSISTELNNENHIMIDHQRPLSFQVLQTNFDFDIKCISTYNDSIHASIEPALENNRYKSLADLSFGSELAQAKTWKPSTVSTTDTAPATSSQFSRLLNNNGLSPFGDPLAIKPIVSAFEYPIFTSPISVIPSELKATCVQPFDDVAKSFNETTERSKNIETQFRKADSSKQKQGDFLSLSLSPPINRRQGAIPVQQGCSLSL